jgi:hypothetical protein
MMIRWKQFEITRGSMVEDYKGIRGDDSLSGWYVDLAGSNTVDRRGPGFASVQDAKDAIESVAELHCPRCMMWIGDSIASRLYGQLPSIEHDIDRCAQTQFDASWK